MSQYSRYPAPGGGGGGAVNSVSVISPLQNLGTPADPIIDLDESLLPIGDLGGVSSFSNNTVVGVDNSGEVGSIPGWGIDTNSGGQLFQFTVAPNGETGGPNVHYNYLSINPIADSPDLTWGQRYNQIDLDALSAGFDIGTNGIAARFQINNVQHGGTSDVGGIDFIQNNFNIGNGTDPINVKGFSYLSGFGSINANVNINGQIQGYTFQPNFNAAATMDAGSSGITAFTDGAQIGCASSSYISFQASPGIASIQNNRNYNAFTTFANIPIFSGNAGFFGLTVTPTLGTFDTGGFQGVNVNPTIASVKNADGIYVSMDNVTVFPGAIASLVIQDLTIAADNPSFDANSVTIEYTGGGTAGLEVVSNIGLAFSVQIQDGVSTALQIEAALNAYFNFISILNVTVSGVGSNPQNIQAPTNLTGGLNPGTKRAAYLDGDVEITGSLTFGGALSIGKLNAFAAQAVTDGGGNPQSIHMLISAPTVGDNETIANADTIGINTASLMTIGDNSTVTSGPLNVGLSALGLPAVIKVGAASSVDFVTAALFAISMDAASGVGSSIGNVNLCRAVAIPNGITAITKLKGLSFDLPFGDPGTTTWGVYIEPTTAHNFMALDLKVGGATDVADTGFTLHVEGDTKLEGDLQHEGGDLGIFGAPPVAQPTTAITAATYTAVGGSAVNSDDTFDGYTIGQIVAALRAIGALA